MKCEHGANIKECYFCAMLAMHPGNPLQREKEAEALTFLLARDRLVYGNSFEMDGKRIDPVKVRRNEDGSYTIKYVPPFEPDHIKVTFVLDEEEE